MKEILRLNKLHLKNLLRQDVLTLTGPILAEQTLIMLMGVVNTVMASRLGKEAISAVGMVDTLNMLFIAFLSSLATGSTVVVAHYTGRRDGRSANEGAKQALYSGFIIGAFITSVIFLFRHQLIQFLYGGAEKQVIENAMTYLNITLFTYPLMAVLQIGCGVLRGAGDTRTPMKVTVMMNFINVALSYVLIYGVNLGGSLHTPGLGVLGAALGIAIARTTGSVTILIPLLRGSKVIKVTKLLPVRIDLEMQRSIFNIGIPAAVEAVMFNGGMLLVQIFIVSLGTTSMATNNIVRSIASMINIPGSALTAATTTLVGQHMGRGEKLEASGIIMYLTKLTIIAFALVCLGAFPFARQIVSLYTGEPEIIEMSAMLLRITLVVTVFFWAFSWLLPAGLRGAGDARYTMVTAILGMWFFRIIFAYVLAIVLKVGLLGIWVGMYTDWIVRGALYYIRYRKGRWMEHTVIRRKAAESC